MKKNFGLLFIVPFVFITVAFAQNTETVTLNFDFDKYDINNETASKLDSFIFSIGKRRIALIQLNGHTDSKGSDAYNNDLSLKRAKAIRNYLQAKEVYDSISFIDKGLGKKQLLNVDNTGEQQSLNRRVEMTIKFKKTNDHPDTINTKPGRSLAAILNDTLTKKGSTVTLPNLEFEPGSTKFLSTSLPVLRELRTVLINNPKLKIIIEGHICCATEFTADIHDEGFNYVKKYSKLSEQRAKVVWEYLTQTGIAASRLSYKGFGSTKPIYPLPEKTEAEKIANRRVEIRIVDK